MTAPLAFVDTETTGLDPDRHQIWEVGLILRDSDGVEAEYSWQLPIDLGRADPMALTIGRFYERRIVTGAMDHVHQIHPVNGEVIGSDTMIGWADRFGELTHGAHLVGAVVSFDAERLTKLLRANGACPGWHYHLVDVEALAAGWLAGVRAAVHEKVPNTGEAFWLGSRAWEACEGIEHAPPWNSNDLSRAVGVDPDLFDKHTALGDARWAKAIYEAVMGGA